MRTEPKPDMGTNGAVTNNSVPVSPRHDHRPSRCTALGKCGLQVKFRVSSASRLKNKLMFQKAFLGRGGINARSRGTLGSRCSGVYPEPLQRA